MSCRLCCFLSCENRISKFPFFLFFFLVEQLDAQPRLQRSIFFFSPSFYLPAAAAPQPERFAPHPATVPVCRLIDLSPMTPATQRGQRASDSSSCREQQAHGGCGTAAWKYCRHRCGHKELLNEAGFTLHASSDPLQILLFFVFLLKWHN